MSRPRRGRLELGCDRRGSGARVGRAPTAALFYTTGELTRRVLAARGVDDYEPNVTLMWDGQYRGMQKAVETHWTAFLDGKTTRDAAIRQILIETAPTRASP
jgi:hypothetical protein